MNRQPTSTTNPARSTSANVNPPLKSADEPLSPPHFTEELNSITTCHHPCSLSVHELVEMHGMMSKLLSDPLLTPPSHLVQRVLSERLKPM